jgi:branched-chain amino acid transport system substrate-binding protein
MKKLVLLAMVVGIILSLGAVSAQEDTIKVGAIFDLTGATADVGTPYAAGVRGYIDWVNANGGIEGRQIELFGDDYAYQVPNAENLYAQYKEQGVVVFQGWGTGDTEALAPRISEDQIPFMSASYSAALADPAVTPYNFLAGTSYSDQLVILLQYMLDLWVADGNEAGDMRVAFFHNDSPFGTSPLADGEAFAEEAGFQTARVAMPRGATDYTAELENADASLDGITHIVVQNVSTPAALLFRNARDLGFEDVQFGCLNWCADELMIANAGEAAEGALGAIPFGPVSVDLPGHENPRAWIDGGNTDYESLEEASLHFSQGWWTMAMMMEGVRLVLANGEELTGANIKAALETLENFDTGGVTAPITFTAEDHRGNRALTIYRVGDGLWNEVENGFIDLRAE